MSQLTVFVFLSSPAPGRVRSGPSQIRKHAAPRTIVSSRRQKTLNNTERWLSSWQDVQPRWRKFADNSRTRSHNSNRHLRRKTKVLSRIKPG
ncbi:hypothetical protein RRG08_016234 [Elysia crispata]|uniref:Uncharacterized protein n=1 Tax=Elysia crispata TaxID=231223 RepID=A0AAE1DJP4_9GAST|nr:hypothetical protein RRG08_016234 [Elysia crispata]